MRARIKTTDAPVVFTASGEVFLMSKESESDRSEFRKRVTEARRTPCKTKPRRIRQNRKRERKA